MEEVKRFHAINKYSKKMIMEQVPPPADIPAPAPAPAPAGIPAPAPADIPAPAPTDVPAPAPLDAAPMPTADTEEVDVTDLVNMTKNIKKDIDKNKQEHGEVLTKMDDVFNKLNDLESKLAQMDSLFSKIDSLGNKVESMKEPTAVEKLEMRSLDSYPFSQNPQQFFQNKQAEMKASGKNEYVLTKDEIENYGKDEIRASFNSELADETGF